MSLIEVDYGDVGGGGSVFSTVSVSGSSTQDIATPWKAKKVLFGFIQNILNYGYAYYYDESVSTTQIQYTNNKAWQTLTIDGTGITVAFRVLDDKVQVYNNGTASLTGYLIALKE